MKKMKEYMSVYRKKEVIRQKGQRFYCRDQWRQAIFGSHPRQIVLADCTAVELFDLRVSRYVIYTVYAVKCMNFGVSYMIPLL
jgi:hypothetical protein